MSASMLVGCGTKSTEGNLTASSDIKIGMVADLGGINDESFNQSAWEGLQQAEKDFGIEIVE
ncbi:BMP family ABC transporter substrate-binding protein [Romboutsia sp. 13368]|uniref:BMP family ABC transporter substrate-binding protein n=1 Tax=Romboutsia sp. 13368 TaxID=2708053 RepID=UPI0025EE4EAB|nr:BMP family ABC transporter substrate-binding protein [Romboutsia sp. 13368]